MEKHSSLFGWSKSGITFCGVITLFLMNAALSLLGPAINSMAQAFPEVPLTNIMLISTLPSITGIITNLLIGPIVKKLGYKKTIILGSLLFVATGVAPFFCQTSFTAILVWRAINGLGRGILTPLALAVASFYYDGLANAKMQGLGNTMANVMGMVFASVGGIMAAVNLHSIWWLNVILIAPVAFWLFIQDPKLENTDDAGQTVPVEKRPVPKITWLFVIINAIFLLLMYPIQLYMSPIIEMSGIGDPKTSGLIMTFWSVGGIAAGFVIAGVMKIFKSRVIGVACLGMVILFGLTALTSAVPLFIVAEFVGGFGYALLASSTYAGMGNTAPVERVDLIMGITSAISSLVIFVCPYFLAAMGALFHQTENIRFCTYLGAVGFLICAIIFIIVPLDVTGQRYKK